MSRKLLTDIYIQELLCPSHKLHLEVFDSELIGLYVDVQASSRKSFRLRIRLNQRLKVVTIGDAKLLTVAEARLIGR